MRAEARFWLGGAAVAVLAAVGGVGLLQATVTNQALAQPGSPIAPVLAAGTATAALQNTGAVMTWADFERLAWALDASAWGQVCTGNQWATLVGEVMTVTEVERADGTKTPPGRLLQSPQIRSGVVMIREEQGVWIGDEYWDDVWENELLAIGPAVAGHNERCGDGSCCFVSCGSGSYACCNSNNSNPPCHCRCVPNGNQNVTCQSGGSGATSCSIGYPNP